MGPESGYIYQGLIYCRSHIMAHRSSCHPCLSHRPSTHTHAHLDRSFLQHQWMVRRDGRMRNLGYYYFLRPTEHWKTWTLGKLSLSTASTFLFILYLLLRFKWHSDMTEPFFAYCDHKTVWKRFFFSSVSTQTLATMIPMIMMMMWKTAQRQSQILVDH